MLNLLLLYSGKLCVVCCPACTTPLNKVPWMSLVCTSSAYHLSLLAEQAKCQIWTRACLCVIQNPSRRTRHCRGRAWTARKLDSPPTPGGVSSASCWRKTATRCCPLASTPTGSASSTWTTLKCLPHHQTHTHLSVADGVRLLDHVTMRRRSWHPPSSQRGSTCWRRRSTGSRRSLKRSGNTGHPMVIKLQTRRCWDG